MIEGIATFLGSILYRLRGGLFADLTGIRGTQLMRLIWSLPTAVAMTISSGAPWWVAGPILVSVFAGLALIGHGAHMIMDAELYAHGRGSKTELLTSWWLPAAFGGIPDETWLADRAEDVTLYNVVGMSFIGLCRNTISVLPLFWFAPVYAAVYSVYGLTHGPAYWVGWRIADSSAAGEVVVGGSSWFLIAFMRG